MEDLSDYRQSYEKSELIESGLTFEPMELFKQWFHEADASDFVAEANAMTVSTIGLDGFPKSRVVLLKQYTYEGFVFYTNYESEKGKAIAVNPNVCLSFFWPGLERQVIVKGTAEKVAANISDGYFESRPEGSKLGAVVSNQSEVIPSRAFLEKKLKALETECAGKEITRPEYWGGYLVRPVEMEFWQGRPNRLHDRIRYHLNGNLSWQRDRISP
ncbi:pyridoxamine 5'-phosphate oxidase [Flavobacterium selenitireducens]|uniref:pyridoxamine 5'-phosphate oxidase n=1 Tax=Flavobacterium selenitireducens TaxID=2722704 RepID=UPI00168BB51C|nr:pyridoxamine 5'-phosphate oxidase [Flavobacterium selenitireducens]MBD3581172.1 pyridoxamine 5'-phosphate oxidase [Flavobacterium selenitireducens]